MKLRQLNKTQRTWVSDPRNSCNPPHLNANHTTDATHQISTQRNATYFTLSNSFVFVWCIKYQYCIVGWGLGGAMCICIFICICSCICICICIFICICICICVFICNYICICICICIPRAFCWYWSLLRVVGSIFRKSSESLLVLNRKVRPSTIQLIVRKQTISWFSSRFVEHFVWSNSV